MLCVLNDYLDVVVEIGDCVCVVMVEFGYWMNNVVCVFGI